MERNKIIATVAIIVVGIAAWRTGAMEQGQTGVLKVQAADGIVAIPKNRLRLSIMFNGFLSAVPPQPGEVINAFNQPPSKAVLDQIFNKDCNWLLEVYKEADFGKISALKLEERQQRGEQAARAMAKTSFNFELLHLLDR